MSNPTDPTAAAAAAAAAGWGNYYQNHSYGAPVANDPTAAYYQQYGYHYGYNNTNTTTATTTATTTSNHYNHQYQQSQHPTAYSYGYQTSSSYPYSSPSSSMYTHSSNASLTYPPSANDYYNSYPQVNNNGNNSINNNNNNSVINHSLTVPSIHASTESSPFPSPSPSPALETGGVDGTDELKRSMIEQKCDKNYNMNEMIVTNILNSVYWNKIREYQYEDIIEEIKNEVKHLDPFISNKHRLPSTAFSCLLRLFQLGITKRQMKSLLKHNNQCLKGLALLFLRFVHPPSLLLLLLVYIFFPFSFAKFLNSSVLNTPIDTIC